MINPATPAVRLTTEQSIIRELDQAWTDRLLTEARIEADWFYSPEDRNNTWCHLETARRTIDARRKELDALRAELDEFEARVDRLADAAATVGDPLLTALGYLAHGPDALPATSAADVAAHEAASYVRPAAAPRSQADEALRHALAATPIKAPSRPLSRRAAAVWGR